MGTRPAVALVMTCWRNSSAAGSRRRSADHLRQISRTAPVSRILGYSTGPVADPNTPFNFSVQAATNVTFTLPSEELTDKFVKEAAKNGMVALKGYRTVGGIRASIYNAMPVAGAKALADFMGTFAKSAA